MTPIKCLLIGCFVFNGLSAVYSQNINNENDFFTYLIKKRQQISKAYIEYDKYKIEWDDMSEYKNFLVKIKKAKNTEDFLNSWKNIKSNKVKLVKSIYAFKTKGKFPYEMEYFSEEYPIGETLEFSEKNGIKNIKIGYLEKEENFWDGEKLVTIKKYIVKKNKNKLKRKEEKLETFEFIGFGELVQMDYSFTLVEKLKDKQHTFSNKNGYFVIKLKDGSEMEFDCSKSCSSTHTVAYKDGKILDERYFWNHKLAGKFYLPFVSSISQVKRDGSVMQKLYIIKKIDNDFNELKFTYKETKK